MYARWNRHTSPSRYSALCRCSIRMKRKCNLSRSVFPAQTHYQQFMPDHITDGPYSMTFHYQDEPYFQCFCWARNSNRLRAIYHRSAPSLTQRPIHVMAAKTAIHDFFCHAPRLRTNQRRRRLVQNIDTEPDADFWFDLKAAGSKIVRVTSTPSAKTRRHRARRQGFRHCRNSGDHWYRPRTRTPALSDH